MPSHWFFSDMALSTGCADLLFVGVTVGTVVGTEALVVVLEATDGVTVLKATVIGPVFFILTPFGLRRM